MSSTSVEVLAQDKYRMQRFDAVDSVAARLNRDPELANEAKDLLLRLEESPVKILQGRQPKMVAIAGIRIAALLRGERVFYKTLCEAGEASLQSITGLAHFINRCEEELGLREEQEGNRVRLVKRSS